MLNIAILGAGSWGTALSILLAKNNHKVSVWSAFDAEAWMLTENREHIEKLPGFIVPDNVCFTTDLYECVCDAELIVIAVPSRNVRETVKKASDYIKNSAVVVVCSKGFEENTGLRLSQVIQQEMRENSVVVLTGPSHAEEVTMEMPTTVVAASENRKDAEYVQDAFMSTRFRVYTSPDVIGAETGAALKNIIALCAGISDGLGYGDNTKAALITRGLTEIARMGKALGASSRTFSGLAGMGDLIVTCTSRHSRNWKAGYLIGGGMSPEEALSEIKMTVEGVPAAKAAYSLAIKYGISMPITEQAYQVLFNRKPPVDAVNTLMLRSKKNEIEDTGW